MQLVLLRMNDAWEALNTEWTSNDAIIKQGIAAMIPDSLFLKAMGAMTANGMWKKVKEISLQSQNDPRTHDPWADYGHNVVYTSLSRPAKPTLQEMYNLERWNTLKIKK